MVHLYAFWRASRRRPSGGGQQRLPRKKEAILSTTCTLLPQSRSFIHRNGLYDISSVFPVVETSSSRNSVDEIIVFVVYYCFLPSVVSSPFSGSFVELQKGDFSFAQLVIKRSDLSTSQHGTVPKAGVGPHVQEGPPTHCPSPLTNTQTRAHTGAPFPAMQCPGHTRFLSRTPLSTLLLWMVCLQALQAEASESEPHAPRIAIIGAGAAGAMSAKFLRQEVGERRSPLQRDWGPGEPRAAIKRPGGFAHPLGAL